MPYAGVVRNRARTPDIVTQPDNCAAKSCKNCVRSDQNPPTNAVVPGSYRATLSSGNLLKGMREAVIACR